MYEAIKAREGGAGRSAIAPEILYALWLYATLEGVGSACGLAGLTQEHDACRWIGWWGASQLPHPVGLPSPGGPHHFFCDL